MINKLDNPLDKCDLKFSTSTKGLFEGYASVFNGVDSDGDTIIPGAFTKSLSTGRQPAMFINHNAFDIPVGKYTRLAQDDHGLHVEGQIDMNHRDGPSLASALKNGAMDGMSIGFRIFPDGFKKKDDADGRDITDIDLKEISLVTFPADSNARISVVKSDIDQIVTLKDAELILRDAGGWSRSMATAFVSQLKRIAQSESENAKDEQITMLMAKLREYERAVSVQNTTEQLVRLIKSL